MTRRANPYVGLVPYDEQDAEWFFGRDLEVQLIAANLRASRLTLLYGASGAGKTSLLMAGVLPLLHAVVESNRATAIAETAQGGVLEAERAPLAVAVFHEWRDRPMPRLAAAIREAVAEATGETELEEWDEEERLHDRLGAWTRHVRTVLVILDQFEEYFTYHPDEDGRGTFAGELPAIVNDADLRVNFILSLREDAWAKLDRFKGRIPDLFGNYLRVEFLSTEAAREAIVKPIEHYNATRAPARPASIEPALVDDVLEGVRAGRVDLAESTSSGGPETTPETESRDRVQTPYLQLVMERLWTAAERDGHVLTRATMAQLGGATQIVSGHFSDAMRTLSPKRQAIAADVLGYLVTPSRTKIAQRAADLAVWTEYGEPDVADVLAALAGSDARILRSVPPPGEPDAKRYELYHDVLADAVLEWSDRNRQQRRLARARAARRRRWLWIALGIVTVLAGAGAVLYAILQGASNRLETERARATAASKALAFSAVAQLPVDPERGLLLARAALAERDTGDARDALREAVVASRIRASSDDRSGDGCGPGCAEPAGPRPSSASLVLSPYGTFDPALGTETSGFASLSRDGSTVAFVRSGRVVLWHPASGRTSVVPRVRRASEVAFLGDDRRLLVLTSGSRAFIARRDGRDRPSSVGGGAYYAAVSGDGRYVAVTVGRRVRVFDRVGRVVAARRFTASSLAFNPRNPGILAVGTIRYRRDAPRTGVRLWNWRARTTAVVGPDRLTAPGALTPAFSPGGRLLAFGTGDGGTQVWEIGEERRRCRTPPSSGGVSQARFDASGRRLATVSGNVATIFSTGDCRPLAVLGGHSEPITSIDFAPRRALVATASADGSARVWSRGSGAQVFELRALGTSGRASAVRHVAFTPDGRFVVTMDDERVARIWDVTAGEALPYAQHAAFTADGAGVLLAGLDGRLRRWDVRTNTARTVARIPPSFDAVDIAPGARRVAYTGSFGTRVHDVESGRTYRIGAVVPIDVRWSDDGERLVTMGSVTRIWDARNPASSEVVERIDEFFLEVVVGPRGAAELRLPLGLAIGGLDRSRAELVTARGKAVPLTPRGANDIMDGAFDLRGDRLVTAGREALVWDARDGTFLRRLTGHVGRVLSVAFSADGARIATGGADRTVRVWDAGSGELLGVVGSGGSSVLGVDFDPDGLHILARTEEGPLLMPCDVCRPFASLRRLVDSRLTRDLTREEKAAFLGR